MIQIKSGDAVKEGDKAEGGDMNDVFAAARSAMSVLPLASRQYFGPRWRLIDIDDQDMCEVGKPPRRQAAVTKHSIARWEP